MAAGLLAFACLGVLAAMNSWMGSRAETSADPDGRIGPENPCPVDWGYWLAVNPDVVAWIEIPGTSISHPVVQAHADNPGYYLSHDVFREWNPYGCPYIDAECAFGIDSWNVVISGHNIDTPPAMLHDLANFHDPEYLANHHDITLYTPQGIKRLNAIGAKTIPGWSEEKKTGFATANDFLAWRNEKLSEFGQSPAGVFSQVVTLCSCSYFFNPSNERTLVYAM